MTEYWECKADNKEKLKYKCANIRCKVFCDVTNRFLCDKCEKIHCVKCRLYESHFCKEFQIEQNERNIKEPNKLLYDDLHKYEKIQKQQSKTEFAK